VAGAAVVLALSLAISYGTLEPYALALVTLAGLAAFLASRLSLRGEPFVTSKAPVIILGLGLALSILHDILFLPGVLVDPARLGGFRPGIAAIALLLGSYFWRRAPQWFVRSRFPAIVLIGTGLGALILRASPSPGIDVWHLLQGGAQALLSGENPYSALYTNIYGPGTSVIDPSLLSADRRHVIAIPYMPLTLVLVAPAAWVGDVRWANLAAMALAALLVRMLGRGSVEAELAGAFLLLQPQGFFVLELSWIEPIVLAAMLLLTLAIERVPAGSPEEGKGRQRAWIAAGLAGGLAASCKQYVPMLLLPLFFAIPARARIKTSAVAIGGALVVLLPFVAWDPAGFFRGIVEFQIRQPFRYDALSWLAAIAALGGPVLPSWPAFLLAGASLIATTRRTISLGQGLLAGAVTWIAFVAFNKQAFCNYYWLAVGLLCAALAILTRRQDVAPTDVKKDPGQAGMTDSDRIMSL
jgi:hypothetical protein